MKAFDYFAPQKLGEAMSLLRRHGKKASCLAGGTDLLLRMERRAVSPGVLIDLKKVRELNGIKASGKGLIIGALTPMEDIVSSRRVQRRYAILGEAASLVGSLQTRNRATVGGNLCNASPAADTATPLIALSAKAKIVGSGKQRVVPLDSFFVGPGKTCMKPNELLKEIIVPSPPTRSGGSFQRCTRTVMDIAVVNSSIYLTLDSKGGTVKDVRIALGAVAPIPLRAKPAEEFLKGKKPDQGTIEEAATRAAGYSRPIDDVRSSAYYRREMVRVLTRRALQEAVKRARGEG